jgi:uncharacterized protein (DUF1778 family)
MSREQTLERYLKIMVADNRELIRLLDKSYNENKKLRRIALDMASDIDRIKKCLKGSDDDE